MRFYRLAELFLRYSQRVDSGGREDRISTLRGNAPSGDEPPAHWLEMARRQAPRLYRSVLSRRIEAAQKALNAKAGDGDDVAESQRTVAEKPDHWPLPPRGTPGREALLPGESRARVAAPEERSRASSIDYRHGELDKPVEPGGASVPNRPAKWLAKLRPGKAKAKAAHPPGGERRDTGSDTPLLRVPAVDASPARGERPPSGIGDASVSSSDAIAQRQPVPPSAGAERGKTRRATQKRAKSAGTAARQGSLSADVLGDEMATRASTPGIGEITGGDRLDRKPDAAEDFPAASHRSLEETSRERRKVGISRLPPSSTHPVHELPPAMSATTGREAERLAAPLGREAQSVESPNWPLLPDQVGKGGEALPWASLPDDVWTQPLQHAAMDRAGSPGHELYGPGEHKLSG